MLNIVTGSGNHVSVEIAFKVRQTGDPAKTAQLRRLDAVIFSQAVFSQPKYMKSEKSTILARAPPSLSSFFFLRSARPEQARTWQEKKGREGGDKPSHSEQNYAGAAVPSLLFFPWVSSPLLSCHGCLCGVLRLLALQPDAPKSTGFA